jgi:hypothetical protein
VLRHRLLPRAAIDRDGAGASMTAVRDGRPLDTTMGLTPTSASTRRRSAPRSAPASASSSSSIRSATPVTTPRSPPRTHGPPSASDEELMIARHVRRVLAPPTVIGSPP